MPYKRVKCRRECSLLEKREAASGMSKNVCFKKKGMTDYLNALQWQDHAHVATHAVDLNSQFHLHVDQTGFP